MISRALAFGLLTLALVAPSLAGFVDTPISTNKYKPTTDSVNPVAQLTDAGKDDGFCTVFYIGHARFVSAGHCAEKSPMHILFQDGTFKRLDVEVVAVSNPDQGMPDFIVLEASPDAAVLNGLKGVDLDCGHKAKVGDDIYIKGFPADLGFLTTWGKVAGKTEKWALWDKPVIRTNIAVSNGDSGGPAYDQATGKVIGILVGALPKNQNLSAVQPIGPICKLLGIGG